MELKSTISLNDLTPNINKENEKPNNNDFIDDISTEFSLDIPIKERKIETEIKDREKKFSKAILEKNEIEEEDENEENENKEKIIEKIDENDTDYVRRDKQGIHFQIINDDYVSVEMVLSNSDLLKNVESMIKKFKGFFDNNIKLWLVPYKNYLPLYEELILLENVGNVYKVGSIASKYYANKNYQKIEFQRGDELIIIDYSEDQPRELNLKKNLQNALYDFQKEGILFGLKHNCRFLLADEMGVGKTIQAISLTYIYRDEWPVLIICPGSMKYLWKSEIKYWLGLKDQRIFLVNTSRQKIPEDKYFYIISYDMVRKIKKKLKNFEFRFVILDEAHSIKNMETQRAKNIIPIAVRSKRLLLLTGTPLLSKPLEGYPLLYALRPDIFTGFKKYGYRYCDPQPTPFGVSWSGASNTKELHWIMSTLMIRRLKKEVLGVLPPKVRTKRSINVDKDVIEKIKSTRSVKGRKSTIDAYNLTAIAKKKGVITYLKDFLEILDNNNKQKDKKEKLIIFGYHIEILDSIENFCIKNDIGFIRIDGNTKQDIRYDNVNSFQRDPNVRIAILSIIAASTGITLTSAHIVIFAELTWTPSIMIQAEDRAHRIGQRADKVDIHYLYGPETLDDFMLDRLQKKLTIVSTTVDDKQEDFGVVADPEFIEAEVNDRENSDEEEDLEKKMFKDLMNGDESVIREKLKSVMKNKRNFNKKSGSKNIRNKSSDVKSKNVKNEKFSKRSNSVNKKYKSFGEGYKTVKKNELFKEEVKLYPKRKTYVKRRPRDYDELFGDERDEENEYNFSDKREII